MSTRPYASGRSWHAVFRLAFPVLFYLAWASLFTFPLVTRLSSSIIQSTGGDGWQHLWGLWWVKHALVDLHQNPYVTDLIQYPTGVTLLYHPIDLLTGVVSIPLQLAFGLPAAFNLLVLANLTLVGLSAYWLCIERTGSFWASLLAGALFAVTPLLNDSLNRGQLEQLAAWWQPLYMIALLRALDSPGAPWVRGGGRRAVLAAGLCLVGASLATWYFTAGLLVFTVVFTPCYLAAQAHERGERWLEALRPAALKVAITACIPAVLLSPLLGAMAAEQLSGQTYMLSPRENTLQSSADLASPLLTPRLSEESTGVRTTNTTLGYLLLVPALLGFYLKRRRVWPFAVAALALLILAFGPELQWFGTDTGLPMPAALLEHVPLVGASRQPLRFLSTASLCLVLAAAFAFSAVTTLRRRAPAWTALLAASVLAGAAIELFDTPRIMASTAADPVYGVIAARSEPGAVMELPFQQWQGLAMWHQTTHARPILGGYLARHYPYPLTDAPVPGISQLYRLDASPITAPDIFSPRVSQTARVALNYYGARFIVVHRADLSAPQYATVRSALGTLFNGQAPAYSDQSVDLYITPPAQSALPLLAPSEGWYQVEGSGPTLHRWMKDEGSLWLYIPQEAAGDYHLALTAYSYLAGRHMTISLDGRQVGQEALDPSFRDIDLDLGTLGTGEHTVTFRSDDLPAVPPGDNRQISIGFTRVALTHADR